MYQKPAHSIKVPKLYKESAKAVKQILLDGASLKTLVFKNSHPNVQGIYALVSKTLQQNKELQYVIDKSNILIDNPRFDPYLARVLITQLLWGKNPLQAEAKPIQVVLSYKEKLQQALLQNPNATIDPCDKKKVRLPRYVRVNTLLATIDEVVNAFYDDGWNLLPNCDNYTSHLKILADLKDFDFIQDFHIPELLVFPPGTQFHDHPGYKKGILLLQDKASCLSAFLLNPKQNSEIIDLCAAPGMKTTHLAAIINNLGKIYAVEQNERRYKTLCEFVTHTNAYSIETMLDDALMISPQHYPNVKYILVDPSCSGSGMNRIEIEEQNENSMKIRLKKLHSLQVMILSHAFSFPNVEKIVYSTCSIYPEENEHVVEKVLRKVGDTFTLANIKKKLKNDWLNFGSVDQSKYGEKCIYAIPGKDLCNGFFVAVFKRKSKDSDNLQNNVPEMEINIQEEDVENNSFYSLQNIKESDDNCEKVKKAKKHKISLNEENNVAEHKESFAIEHEEVLTKISKRKKKHSNENVIKASVTMDYVDDSEAVKVDINTEIKKRKKNKINTHEIVGIKNGSKENIEIAPENLEKNIKKSKKERKQLLDNNDESIKTICVTIDDVTKIEVEEETLEKLKKKKKKKDKKKEKPYVSIEEH